MTVALSLLVVACFAGAVRVFASYLANCDDVEREHAIDAALRRRYQQPAPARSWR